MQVVAIIPARYASTRLECKLLLDLAGKSVLQRTYEQTCKAKYLTRNPAKQSLASDADKKKVGTMQSMCSANEDNSDIPIEYPKVIIATDDQRIFDHARSFGAEVFMTSLDHKSGTDRIAELAEQNQDWQIIVNVQGDEPMINPDDIDKAIEPFLHDPLCQMTSLYHCISDPDEINNPNNVKVVTNANNDAMYFSRAVIPFDRDQKQTNAKKHIGLYAYTRDTLLQLANLAQSELEKTEKLEQLRALDNGIKIKMLEVKSAPIGIDTVEDYQKARIILNQPL
ncbi:MAG: 3-deoxy-manno-octulosonate cytidylyltransferase [Cyanobacteria bacterium]|nr:3-deoxy-manno-octulosonate cytidylyltransferase [Cyanobacteriota bacterium]MDA1021570.1 3-deoxy-manno-octulosonate cytidylyltransferase [Cyanobacteriota bacterium]